MVDYSEIDSENKREIVVYDIRKIVLECDSNVLVLTIKLRRPIPDLCD